MGTLQACVHGPGACVSGDLVGTDMGVRGSGEPNEVGVPHASRYSECKNR